MPSIPLMRFFTLISLFVACVSHTVTADTFIRESNEIFKASQTARAEAMQAFQDKNASLALAKMQEAHTLRPYHAGLIGYMAYLAAETGDADVAYNAAQKYAALNQVPGAGILAKIESIIPAEHWQPLKDKFDKIGQQSGDLTVVTTLPTNMKLIEGIAADQDDTLYFSAVVSGNLYKFSGGETTLLLEGKTFNIGSFFGIAFNPERNSLLATFAKVPQTPTHPNMTQQTGLIEVDVTSGKLMNKWVLAPSEGDHQIADVLISKKGTIYVSDALGKAVYKVDDQSLSLVVSLPHSMSPQGLAETKEGHLILADYGRGLWRIDTTKNSAHLLAIPEKLSLLGLDGLAAHNGKLIAIQNGASPHRVLELDISADGSIVKSATILAKAHTDFSEPTLGVSTDKGFIFIAGSQWPIYGDGGVIRDGQKAIPTKVLRFK